MTRPIQPHASATGLIAALAVCCLLSVSSPVSAAEPENTDLYRFLPNHGNSVYNVTGLLRKWPAGGPKKLWQVELGWGKAAVVEVAGQAFTTTETDDKQYAVCLDPATGQTEIATLLLARLSSGRGNTIRPRALAADASGNVYVGGVSTFSPPKTEGSFGREGGGAFLVIFDKDLNRRYATTLAGGATTRAVAVAAGTIVAVGDCKTELVTHQPLKPQGDEAGDGFAVIFRDEK